MSEDKGPKLLQQWLRGARKRGRGLLSGRNWKRLSSRVRFDPKRAKNVSEYTPWIQTAIVILAIFLLAEVSSRIIGLFVRPTYLTPARKVAPPPSAPLAENFDSILTRNMFNVEGKIPDPFDQGRLDCFSQARLSNAKINILGTIVMADEKLSVALITDDSSGSAHVAVRKDDTFGDGRYQALKVERKKLCFQVKATQDLEYVEIPDEGSGLGTGPAYGGAYSEGILATSETDFSIKKDFLDRQLLDLNNILQTARAVPYIEPGTGKFKGFLVQSIDSNSPFLALGVRQGDVLSAVNGMALNDPGKALEAFQMFRNATSVNLRVVRGGQEVTLNYAVK